MEWLAGLALVTPVIVVRHLAVRRMVKGDRWFAWVYFAPTLMILGYLVWIAIGLWTTQPVAAIGLGVVGGASLVLFVRVVREMASATRTTETIGELTSPFFDYIIWAAIGAPMVLVALLLALLVTGALGSR